MFLSLCNCKKGSVLPILFRDCSCSIRSPFISIYVQQFLRIHQLRLLSVEFIENAVSQGPPLGIFIRIEKVLGKSKYSFPKLTSNSGHF